MPRRRHPATNQLKTNDPICQEALTDSHFVQIIDVEILGKDEINFKSKEEATNFVRSFLNSSDKLAMLSLLTSSRYGLINLTNALSFDKSVQFCQEVVLPLIFYLGNDDRLLIGPARVAVLFVMLATVYKTPLVFETLVHHVNGNRLVEDDCFAVGWLLLQFLKYKELASEVRLDENALKLAGILGRSKIPSLKFLGGQIAIRLESKFNDADVPDKVESIPSLHRAHPGGRHDNDYEDFRSISIYPTVSELTIEEPSYLPVSDMILRHSNSVPLYYDWAFRLFREDAVRPMKEEIALLLHQNVSSSTDKKRLDRLKTFTVKVLRFSAISFDHRFGISFTMAFQEPGELKQSNFKLEKRQSFLKEQSVLAFIRNENELVGLGVVCRFRKIQNSTKSIPIIKVVLTEKLHIERTVAEIGLDQTDLTAVQLSTSFIGYAPVLERLQTLSAISAMPFKEEFLGPNDTLQHAKMKPSYQTRKLETLTERLDEASLDADLAPVLHLSEAFVLDKTQKEAVTSSLKRRVALIQGPPGTGKSFCGAILSKIIHDFSRETILCVCYTNHALDQFLEDLIDFGLPRDEMVRLGSSSKMSERIKDISAQVLLKRGRSVKTNREAEDPDYSGSDDDSGYSTASHQFSDREQKKIDDFHRAMRVKEDECKRLIIRLKEQPSTPRELLEKSLSHAEQLHRCIVEFEELRLQLNEIFKTSFIKLLKSRRILGCTTTGAAKYAKELDAVGAGVLIIEESGEITEPHVTTSIPVKCKHLIMIGDHKQLRPKVNCYDLTVEQGGPYKLNRSLFERLVSNGFPHVTLQLQHRMPPEISDLVRQLTYPELRDAEKVLRRPNILGTTSKIIFIHHEKPEGSNKVGLEDNLSKVNQHEVEMVSQLAKYLLAQGYRGEQIVVLTPYLGQLQMLREAMSKICDTEVSELDIADLYSIGVDVQTHRRNCRTPVGNIASSESTRHIRPVIRVSTIDNYQGEEADIVIGSLVRSNPEGIVGFVGEPQRINVLLSRARIGMILIGNMRTFENCKSTCGRELWTKLLAMFKDKKSIFSGFPAYCSIHRRSFLVANVEDFCKLGPVGYCSGECNNY